MKCTELVFENKSNPPYTNLISLSHLLRYASTNDCHKCNFFLHTCLYSRTFIQLHLHFHKHQHTFHQLVLLATHNAYIYFKF